MCGIVGGGGGGGSDGSSGQAQEKKLQAKGRYAAFRPLLDNYITNHFQSKTNTHLLTHLPLVYLTAIPFFSSLALSPSVCAVKRKNSHPPSHIYIHCCLGSMAHKYLMACLKQYFDDIVALDTNNNTTATSLSSSTATATATTNNISKIIPTLKVHITSHTSV